MPTLLEIVPSESDPEPTCANSPRRATVIDRYTLLLHTFSVIDLIEQTHLTIFPSQFTQPPAGHAIPTKNPQSILLSFDHFLVGQNQKIDKRSPSIEDQIKITIHNTKQIEMTHIYQFHSIEKNLTK